MNTDILVTAGLQPQQAEAYALLLETGGIAAPEAAKKLGLTRTNAYKVLDRLVEIGLASKQEVRKKYLYAPSNPLALAQLVNEARNQVVSQEEAVKKAMNDLLARYHQHLEQPYISVVTGQKAVANAYRSQINLRQPVYFVRSQADISSMGFDTMHEIRVAPAHYGQDRFGITPDVLNGPTNPDGDNRSRLTRTWVKREEYSAPVEWSVSGDMLLIVLFGSEPHAVSITNPFIADAFRQLWKIMDTGLRLQPDYDCLPRAKSNN